MIRVQHDEKEGNSSSGIKPYSTKRTLKAIAAIGTIVLLGGALFYLWKSGIDIHWNEEHLYSKIQSLGILAPFASIGLMVLHSFLPFPGEVIAMLNGALFGVFWGVIYSWIGAMIGAYLSFFLTRKWGMGLLRGVFPAKRIENLAVWKSVDSPWTLIIVRLIPLISFNLLNYVLGLSSVSFRRFSWTTAIGILPGVTVSVVFGNSFAQSNTMMMMISGGLIVILIGILWVRKRRGKGMETDQI